MEDTHEEERLLPKWLIDTKLVYKIWKKETFNFKESHSPIFERDYTVELRLLENNIVEAYYPNSLLSTVKLLDAAHKHFGKINHAQQNTLYYEIDDNFKFQGIKNLDKLIQNIKIIKQQLKEVISEAEYEEIVDDIEVLESTPSYVSKHFGKDIETIHDFYGSPVYDGYYFDLDEQDNSSKSLKKKLLGLVKLNLGQIDVLQTDFLNEENYQIELLKGKDTISTKSRQNFEQIKEEFVNHQFKMVNYNDITLHHQKFHYSTQDFILKKYNYQFKIDTPTMKKLMQSKIELIY